MSFAAANFCRFAVNENFLDDKAHATKSVSIAILPDGVVVDFVDAVDETYLKTSRRLVLSLDLIWKETHQVRNCGFSVGAAHLLEESVVSNEQQWASSLGWRVLVLISLTLRSLFT